MHKQRAACLAWPRSCASAKVLCTTNMTAAAKQRSPGLEKAHSSRLIKFTKRKSTARKPLERYMRQPCRPCAMLSLWSMFHVLD